MRLKRDSLREFEYCNANQYDSEKRTAYFHMFLIINGSIGNEKQLWVLYEDSDGEIRQMLKPYYMKFIS